MEDHGTHCAGTIGADRDNGLGIAGIAKVKLMTSQIFGRREQYRNQAYISILRDFISLFG